MMRIEDIWNAVPEDKRRKSGLSLEHIQLVARAMEDLSRPAPVKELTDEEFAAETQRAIDAGFPDLAPCCKKEVRDMDGWCTNCGQPGF